MEQFAAKKLGEVLAFARVGAETIERGRAALDKTFGAENMEGFLETNRKQAEKIEELARKMGVAEITLPKSEKTGEKLRAMRELYLKEDDWQDAAELMEWLGFFEGAAVIHWRLVEGAVEKSGERELIDLAAQGAATHAGALEKVGEEIHSLARERVAAGK